LRGKTSNRKIALKVRQKAVKIVRAEIKTPLLYAETTRASPTVRIGAICNALERNGENIKDYQGGASHRLLKMRCSPID